ncbi:hypothetical protein L2E82_30463 [Cichorium intybus]|uniref:Uncharacterized protein n=1 Tax=Cichorium intybus TaxID=13427 RepID=A0ACB9D0N9_CICIN|nr:hypothetical protein L2E82_30463 [Cichorium intybus]
MVKYIGGFWILFDVKTEEEEEKIQNSPEIKACLKSLRRWGEEFCVQDRITWLKTEVLDQISETVTLNIGKNSFKVRVSEIHRDVEGLGIKSSNSKDQHDEEETEYSSEDGADFLSSEEEGWERFSDEEFSNSNSNSNVQETQFLEQRKLTEREREFNEANDFTEELKTGNQNKYNNHENNENFGKKLDTDSPNKESPTVNIAHFDPNTHPLKPDMDLRITTHFNVTENKLKLDGCSDNLKALLSRETPIKKKIELIEKEKSNEKKENMESMGKNSISRQLHLSPRITKSQSKMSIVHSTSKDCFKCEDEKSIDSACNSGCLC